MNNQLWYFLVHGLINEKQGAYTNFFAYGEHLGDALDLTIRNSHKAGFINCDLVEASLLDEEDNLELLQKEDEIAVGLFMTCGLSIYELSEDEDFFIYPTGIVKSCQDSEYDEELIKEQFIANSKDDNGIYSLTLTPDKRNIENLFFSSLEFIPSVDSLAFFLESDWENEKQTELWINKSLVEKQLIIDLIKENISNTILNGNVATVIYSLKGETNLVIDAHKQLKLTTKDEQVFNEFGNGLIDMGFEQTKELYTLEYGYYHWHYRTADSLTKNKFREYLTNNRFEILEQ